MSHICSKCYGKGFGNIMCHNCGGTGMEPFKKCACGIAYSADQWLDLQHVGMQHFEADDFGPKETIEMRNCHCGSTMAITIDAVTG